jgi:hypothetical protein
VSDWLTIRVVLEGTVDTTLDEAPGRIFLVHVDHTFDDLAEAIDLSLGRWDLGPLGEFEIEGQTLIVGGDEDTADVTVGELAPRSGERFLYTFDPDERWRHACTVEAVDVDAEEEYGEEPATPVPLFGWGTIPDQYWRVTEDDADDYDDTDDGDDGSWSATEAWTIVQQALRADPPFDVDAAALRKVTTALRRHGNDQGWPYEVLLAAAGLTPEDLPDDDETLWLAVTAGVVRPADDLPVPPAEESAWTALEPADWAALVIELERLDPEVRIDAPSMLEMIERCPAVEEQELSPEEEHTLLRGLDLVRRLLETLGVIDAAGHLTPLGRWGLPRAVERGFLSGELER